MIKIYFTFEGQNVVLPVNPEQIEIVKPGANKTVEIVKLGKVNILRAPDLARLTIDSFFPSEKGAPYATSPDTFYEPQYYIDFFESVRAANKPMEIGISNTFTLSGINIKSWVAQMISYGVNQLKSAGSKPLVSIENFAYKRTWGSDDVSYQLDLMEYISYGSTAMEGESEIKREVTKETPMTHTVVKGDTLWAIAQQYLGSGSRYPEIAKLNNISNPDKIYPGQVFTIPPK